MTPEELKKRIDATNVYLVRNRIAAFNRPKDPLYPEIRDANPLQKKLIEAWKNPVYKVFTYTGGNRIGKTTIGAIIANSTVFGEWPWSGEKLYFPHKEPRKVRYIGQTLS